MKDQLLIDKYEDYVSKHSHTENAKDEKEKQRRWVEEKASVLDFTSYTVTKMARILAGQILGEDVTDQEKEELWIYTREVFDILREMTEEQLRELKALDDTKTEIVPVVDSAACISIQ